MEKQKHTPGDWFLKPNGSCYNVHSPDRTDHFMILVGMTHNNEGEFEANVKRVVTACKAHDDLLEACKNLLADTNKILDYCPEAVSVDTPRIFQQVKAAIDKAAL